MEGQTSLATVVTIALIVLTLAGLGAVGLVAAHRHSAGDGSPPTPSRTSGGSSTGPVSQFAVATDDLNGYTDRSGTRYLMRGDPGHTGLAVRDGRIVRLHPSNAGPNGAPIAVVADRGAPSTVSLGFVFTPGLGRGESAVVGSCARSFTDSSIQLATYPDQWKLFYTEKRTGLAGTDIVTIAQGTLGPLKTDGSTVYTESMKVDLAGSSVTIQVPGTTRTVTDPHIAKFWGAYTALQIRHPNTSDGDVQITAVTSVVN